MLRYVGFIVVSAAVSSFLFSQTAPGQLPSDATTLLDLGRQKNGLNSPDLRPWHLHGSYTLYGKKGDPAIQGTYEEWWLTPTKYRVDFSSASFAQTDYANGAELFRDGSQDWPQGYESSLRERLINPLPPSSLLADMHLEKRTVTLGKAKLECVSMRYPIRSNLTVSSEFFPSVCFEPTQPILRLDSNAGSQIIYDDLVAFQGHFLAKHLEIFISGKLEAELKLDLVETIANPTNEIVNPPSTAKSVELADLKFKASVTRYPSLLKKAVPVYPDNAKAERIQGTVRIQASVGEDGHIRSMTVIDGPFELRQAAQDALKQWVYWPPEILGQPRPFEIEVKVIFSLA